MATEVGTRIKRARERRRWSQRQLAEALKVDRKTVDNWENGRTSPRSSIGAIEEVLGFRFDDPDPPDDVLGEDLRAMIRRNFPPDRAEALLDTMEGLLTGRLVARPTEPPAGMGPRRQAG